MTPEEEKARKKKFDAITEDTRTIAHFKKFFRQYINDSFFTIGLKIDQIHPMFRVKEMFGEFKPTFDWRKGIHDQLKSTIFKECNIIEVTPQNAFHVVARYMGMFANIEFAAERMDASEDANDPLLKELAAEYFNEDVVQALPESEQGLGIESLLRLVAPSIQKELSTEYGKGVTSVFKDNLELAHQTSATDVYFFLLYLGDYVEVFNSVEECHDYLGTRMKPEELGGLTAFRQLWTRIHKHKSD